MKVNATNSCGEYYLSIEIEYDSEKEKDCVEAASHLKRFWGTDVSGKQAVIMKDGVVGMIDKQLGDLVLTPATRKVEV